jgi:hypothetical protein
MGMIENNISQDSFEGVLDYQFNLSGGFGAGTNAFNTNIDIAKIVHKQPSFATWNAGTKKIVMADIGKYRVSIDFRAMITMNTQSVASRYDLELWVDGAIVSYVYIHTASGAITFNREPFYNDADAAGAGSGTTSYSVSGTVLTANGYYFHSNTYNLTSGSEIYLKSYNTAVNYSSPTRTAPEGSTRIQNLTVSVTRVL